MKTTMLSVIILLAGLCDIYAHSNDLGVTDTTNVANISHAKKVISVTTGSAGDVNNDGKLTISDVAEMAYILKVGDAPESAVECNFDAANVDGSEQHLTISQNDEDLLVEWVLNGKKD